MTALAMDLAAHGGGTPVPSGAGGAAALAPVPLVKAAMDEVKTLGGCCKDSDNVIAKINELHEKLAKLGVYAAGRALLPTLADARSGAGDGQRCRAAAAWRARP